MKNVLSRENADQKAKEFGERIDPFIRVGWFVLFADTGLAAMGYLLGYFLPVPGILLAFSLLWGVLFVNHCRGVFLPMFGGMLDKLTGEVVYIEADLSFQEECVCYRTPLRRLRFLSLPHPLHAMLFLWHQGKRLTLHALWEQGQNLDESALSALFRRRQIAALRVRVSYSRFGHFLLTCEPFSLPPLLNSTETDRANAFFASL